MLRTLISTIAIPTMIAATAVAQQQPQGARGGVPGRPGQAGSPGTTRAGSVVMFCATPPVVTADVPEPGPGFDAPPLPRWRVRCPEVTVPAPAR